jgi:hypothetical protein
MLLSEIREILVKQTIQGKERICQKGAKDLRPVIDVYRGGEPVATIRITAAGGGQTLALVYGMAVTGFDADQGAYVMETYTNGPNLDPPDINPITGEGADATTLSTLFLRHDGGAKGWVSECLFIHVANKAGDIQVARLPYHYAVNGRYLVWDELWLSPENAENEEVGVIAEAYGPRNERHSKLQPGLPGPRRHGCQSCGAGHRRRRRHPVRRGLSGDPLGAPGRRQGAHDSHSDALPMRPSLWTWPESNRRPPSFRMRSCDVESPVTPLLHVPLFLGRVA